MITIVSGKAARMMLQIKQATEKKGSKKKSSKSMNKCESRCKLT